MDCDKTLMIVGAILGTLISVSINCFFQWRALPSLTIIPAESAQKNNSTDCVYANVLVRNATPNRFMSLFVQRQPAINVVVRYKCYIEGHSDNINTNPITIGGKSCFLARWGSAPETGDKISGMFQFPIIHSGDDDQGGRNQFNVLKIVPNGGEHCSIVPCTNETYRCVYGYQEEGFPLDFNNNNIRILVKMTAASVSRSVDMVFRLEVDNRYVPKFVRA